MLTQAELKEFFHYDPETGVFTRIKRVSGRCRVGDIVGSPDELGYLRFRVNGKKYRAHRLAWLYVYGSFPENEIDHINHDRSDNRISNLRQATRAENVWNSRKSGCSYDKQHSNYRARICKNGRRIHLGRFDTLKQAQEAYAKAAKQYHGEFACAQD